MQSAVAGQPGVAETSISASDAAVNLSSIMNAASGPDTTLCTNFLLNRVFIWQRGSLREGFDGDTLWATHQIMIWWIH